MRKLLVLLTVSGFIGVCSAQEGEISVSAGVSRFGNATIGSVTGAASDLAKMNDGFRLGFRLTFNNMRFFGHEVGYAYNRSGVNFSGQDVSVPVHQGFYDFMVYATPKDT